MRQPRRLARVGLLWRPRSLNSAEAHPRGIAGRGGPSEQKKEGQLGLGANRKLHTAAAYNALQPTRNSSQTPEFWKKVWEPLALPKVNFFFWTLVHNKLLTGDNLEKKSITGPHRCVLCRNNIETAKHLFMECMFAKEVWGLILHELQISVPPFNSVADLFASWTQCYPNKIPSKSFWRKVWIAIPKFVCWPLARNDLIFNETMHVPLSVPVKAKYFLLEAAQHQYFTEDPLLLPEEKRWLGPLVLHPRKQLLAPHSVNPEWRKRDSNASIQEW